MGLFVGAGKGIIRSMYIRRESRADFVPADVVINAMLVSTWVHVNHDKYARHQVQKHVNLSLQKPEDLQCHRVDQIQQNLGGNHRFGQARRQEYRTL
jgi:hypothetical protein